MHYQIWKSCFYDEDGTAHDINQRGASSSPMILGEDVYKRQELRSVVILRFFSGYTQAETAAALNIPQGTAATRQKRALALLKLELGEEGQA